MGSTTRTTTEDVPTPANTHKTDERDSIDDFECPKCGGGTYSPTYRVRKCTKCGHRGDATAFFVRSTAKCPDCDDRNTKFGEDDYGNNVYTCKACIQGYREV